MILVILIFFYIKYLFYRCITSNQESFSVLSIFRRFFILSYLFDFFERSWLDLRRRSHDILFTDELVFEIHFIASVDIFFIFFQILKQLVLVSYEFLDLGKVEQERDVQI